MHAPLGMASLGGCVVLCFINSCWSTFGDGTTVATASTVFYTIDGDGARGIGHANVSTGTLHQAAINPFDPRQSKSATRK